jgi:ribosomal protein S18 acetylase RimI-like enzyme
MTTTFDIRRLVASDAAFFKAIRMEMFRQQPREFRYSPEDEESQPLEAIVRRLETDYIVAAFAGDFFAGITGFSHSSGSKLSHKGSLWGMYVRPEMRGSGAGDQLIRAILDHARDLVEMITLTVAANNDPALSLYKSWGFRTYGTEPNSVKLANNDYQDEHLMVLTLPIQTKKLVRVGAAAG